MRKPSECMNRVRKTLGNGKAALRKTKHRPQFSNQTKNDNRNQIEGVDGEFSYQQRSVLLHDQLLQVVPIQRLSVHSNDAVLRQTRGPALARVVEADDDAVDLREEVGGGGERGRLGMRMREG